MSGLRHVLVIGGGISGSAVACGLRQPGIAVTIAERQESPGGVIRSATVSGHLIEAGPNAFLVKAPEVWDLLSEIGLAPHAIEADPAARRRYIVKGGRLLPVPSGPASGLLTPLFPLTSKLRWLAEPFVPGGGRADESVASFVRRRMGRAFLDYAVAPLVSGIYAGDPNRLSMPHAFPSVWRLEQEGGSLVRGAIRQGRARRGRPRFHRRTLSFPGGLADLIRALATYSGARLVCRAGDLQVERSTSVWQATSRSLDFRQAFDAIILTVPTHAWPGLHLPPALAADLASLPEVPYAPVVTVYQAYRRADVGHPLDGFGFLVPPRERRTILGTVFASSLFPGRVPAGQVGLTTFVGGRLDPEAIGLADDQLAARVRGELRDLLDIRGEALATVVHRWPTAIPQYELGHGAFLTSLEALEARWEGLHVHGSFRGGPSLGDCLVNGWNLGHRLATALSGQG